MLELLLTRFADQKLIAAAAGLRFLVFDELHSYRGRQGSDIALLVRRAREAFNTPDLIHVGTSATLAGPGTQEEQRASVAAVASRLFGAPVDPAAVISESLRRATDNDADDEPAFHQSLVDAVRRGDVPPPSAPGDFEAFRRHPLARWLETELGDAAYILDTFPVVKKNDVKRFGTYRTRDTILDLYDRMSRAIATAEPYQTVLDPPPADPRLAHAAEQLGEVGVD